MVDSTLSPQETLQRLLQADKEAQERARRARERARVLVEQAREEARTLVEQVRKEAQAEAGAPEQAETETASTTDADQAYRSDPDALRQRAASHLQEATSRLVAWVTGEEHRS